MAEAVHYHERISSQVSETSATPVTKMTITASELSAAGFAINDDVFLFAWVLFDTSSTNTLCQTRITYNGTNLFALGGDGYPRYDFAGADDGRAYLAIFRIDLGGTIGDIDLDLASTNGSNAVYIEKAEFLVVKASEFGTENTDWFWNENTGDDEHNTDWSETDWTSSFASITFEPASVEDWVIFGCAETQIDAANLNHEMRINMDSGTFFGSDSGTNVPSEEGEATSEEKVWSFFDVIQSLSAASHTFDLEVQDDAGGTNDHRRGALLIFRKDVWADLYVNEAGDQTVANDTDVQVATITDTLSATQNVVMMGYGFPTPINSGTRQFMWIRQDGTTVIDPVINQAAGNQLSVALHHDNTDQAIALMLAYKNLSGTLDLDLFYHQDATGSETLHKTTLLAWGMELADTGTTVNAGLATETDSALGVTVLKVYPAVGLATETDTALGVTALKAYPVLRADETDSVPGVVGFAKTFTMGLALETDSALGVQTHRDLAAGLATETDSALAAVTVETHPVLLATETDSALGVSIAKTVNAGLATETDSALTVTIPTEGGGLLSHFASMIGA